LTTVDPYSRVIADGQVLTTPAIQLKALQAQYSTLTAQYGPDHPDVLKAKHQIEALQSEIASRGGGTTSGPDVAQLKAQMADVQTNLNVAKKTQGSQNPDVVNLTHQMEKLQTQLAEASKSSATHNDHLKQDADNPAYLELVSQLHSLEEQHKSLLEQRTALVEQQKKYQMALSETPASEQEMAALTRDYENAQLRYRELKEKKMAADMGTQMQEQRIGERLVVIKPPQLPTKTQPSRILLLLGGFLVSIMGGIASVVMAEAIGQSVHGAQHLGTLVGVPPLVSVPYIYTSGELSRFVRMRQRFFGNNY
jgi:polysaccharide biosynthesis transport protein